MCPVRSACVDWHGPSAVCSVCWLCSAGVPGEHTRCYTHSAVSLHTTWLPMTRQGIVDVGLHKREKRWIEKSTSVRLWMIPPRQFLVHSSLVLDQRSCVVAVSQHLQDPTLFMPTPSKSQKMFWKYSLRNTPLRIHTVFNPYPFVEHTMNWTLQWKVLDWLTYNKISSANNGVQNWRIMTEILKEKQLIQMKCLSIQLIIWG